MRAALSDAVPEPTPTPRGRKAARRWAVRAAVLAAAAFGLWLAAVPLATRRAESLLTARRPAAAAGWADFAHAIGGRSERLLLTRARARRHARDIAGMNAALTQAEASGADPQRVRLEKILAAASVGRLREVEAELPRLLVDYPRDGRDVCEAFAGGYIAAYRVREAAPLLRAWREAYPDDPQAYLLQGRVDEHAGDWDSAADLYEKALEVDPRYGPAAFNLARVHLNRNDPAAALEHYRAAVASLADDTPAAVGEAQCLRRLGRLREAEAVLRGRPTAATDASRRAFAAVGQSAEAAETAVAAERGHIAAAAGRTDEAAEHFAAAVAANPKDQSLRYVLAQTLSRLGRAEEAREHMDAYVRAREATAGLSELLERVAARPGDADLRAEIGRTFLENLSEQQGLIWLHSALAHEPDHQAANRALADYYAARVDDTPKGRRNAERAAEHRARLRGEQAEQ